MSHSLPDGASLQNLKNQAKSLLKSFRRKDAAACAPLKALHRFAGKSDADILTETLTLAEAQFALSLDYGFSSWADLKAYVELDANGDTGAEAADAPNILSEMRFDNTHWGRIEEDNGDRIAVFAKGPSTTLVTDRTWPGDALVVEALGRAEVESRWGLIMQAQLNPYPDRATMKAAHATEPIWPVRCGRREKYIWSDIIYNELNGVWSRDGSIIPRFGSFNGIADKWYRFRAERIGHMLRLWVDGVPVSEWRDPRPVPKELHVWLQSVCSNARFRSLKAYRPSDAYIRKYSRSVPIFDPYALRANVTGGFKGKVVREASITFGDTNREDGLAEFRREDDPSLPEIVDGVSCRRPPERTEDNWPFLGVRLTHPERWNWNNDIRLKVDVLDNGTGTLGVQYKTWHYHGSPLPDMPLTNTGEWRTLTATLREPLLGPPADEADIQICHLRPAWQPFHVRGIRLIEVERPREAHVQAAAACEAEGAKRDDWAVAHWLHHRAMIHRYNLGDAAESDRLMQTVRERYPETECIPIDQLMREKRG